MMAHLFSNFFIGVICRRLSWFIVDGGGFKRFWGFGWFGIFGHSFDIVFFERVVFCFTREVMEDEFF